VKETLEGYPGQQPYEIVMSIRKLAISPDGTSAAVGSNGMAFVDLESGEVLHRFGGQARMQQDIEFSPDGRYVLTGSWAGNVVLWDAKTGEVATLFRGHEGPVLSVAFTADGKQGLSGSADKTARIWDLSDAIK
ncbi:MAG: hypothetical protein L6Q71_07995, partial [Planctomycetes bacterium]|nr:hypothetical protein [Planctomycetota bacterium]